MRGKLRRQKPGLLIKSKTLKMKKFEQLGRSLSRTELLQITGGVTGGCGVKIDGVWRPINPDENGNTKDTAIRYVQNGWATNWCCDSCSWNVQ